MPLISGSSPAAFKQNVRTLMGEVGKSPHVQSREQALAIAYSKQRRGRAEGGAASAQDLPLRSRYEDPERTFGMYGAAPDLYPRWNQKAWDYAVSRMPESENIEDRRGDRPVHVGPPRRQLGGPALFHPTSIAGALQRGTYDGVRQAMAEGGVVDHHADPDLPSSQEPVRMIDLLHELPRDYEEPAYIKTIQRLMEGQKRLNAMNPIQRETLRNYWLGGLAYWMGGSVG
jgi:hypothetical protein